MMDRCNLRKYKYVETAPQKSVDPTVFYTYEHFCFASEQNEGG